MSILLLARLKRVVARLVTAEVAWAKAEEDARGQLMEHFPIHVELQQAREVYNKLLNDLERS